jgi:ParB family chromosome partitioning protein
MTQSTAKPAPLGRGLSALFGDKDTSYQPQPAPAPAEKSSGARVIAITWLQPGAFQPRHAFPEDQLKGLADSIRERGILQPLLVRPVANAKDVYEIVAGERRWRAAQLAGLHEVPVVVRELSDRETLEFGLIENIQRQDLSPLEEAEGYQRLMADFQHTQEGLARILGKSRSHIANTVRLLSLHPVVKQHLRDGLLTPGHARALVTAKNVEALAFEIIRKGLNVRQAEQLVRDESFKPKRWGKKTQHPKSADTAAMEKDLERATGLKVVIVAKGAAGTAGTITLQYQNLEQLDFVSKKLKA